MQAAFIIGGQKCGTTFLASLLDQHPGIRVARPKEPRIFLAPEARIDERWREVFPETGDGAVCVDASVGYSVLTHPDFPDSVGRDTPIPALIQARFPNARFVYIVRDPVRRLFSDYLHHLRFDGQRPPFMDWVARHPEAILRSRYELQLDRYREKFAEEQIRVVDFAALKERPRETARAVSAFFGTEGSWDFVADQGERHEAFLLPGSLAQAGSLVGGGAVGRLVAFARRLTPRPVRKHVKAWFSAEAPRLRECDYEALRPSFSTTFECIEERYGIQLS